MLNKINQLVFTFNKCKIDSLLVTSDINIRYLTGFTSYESWLLISKKGSFYITDARYYIEAKSKLKNCAVVCFKESKYKTVFEIANKAKFNSLGIDENALTLFEYNQLQKNKEKQVKLIKATGFIESFRVIKDPAELKYIKEALKIQKKAVGYLRRIIKPGITEKEVFSKLDKYVKGQGVSFSFTPIIASGQNSVCPHAGLTDRKIRAKDVVLVDFGIDVKGYKSDLTRMFFLGRIPKPMKEIFDSVERAQRAAIEMIKPGIAVASIDKQARNCLSKNKLDRYFTHALGHGVGLDIHEAPRLSQKDLSIFKEGMVITIEPAVYIPGQFGIRIEDMVYVTKKGYEVLSDDIN
ncbi:MAG: Xaa-Pro peptidase family protein [Candidatus Omnitrophica bacterium]|nr:Xaa-Pro peptidase family protein [Candidatus Omnitrophota bacterium]MBU1996456.1 Xaa-Pro peptidase family protein [Candidatus Omnitrophota bacterium]MBU4333095.1 Xaa-Pro peptidase family protein [Candidatus Omnitrophota bacterium]